jgi:hypothetical protein
VHDSADDAGEAALRIYGVGISRVLRSLYRPGEFQPLLSPGGLAGPLPASPSPMLQIEATISSGSAEN